MVDVFNPQYPNETSPFPYTAPDKGHYYNQVDPSSFPGSYNYKKMIYDVSGSLTTIEFYNGATSFADTGSLMFTQQYQYSGSNLVSFLVTVA